MLHQNCIFSTSCLVCQWTFLPSVNKTHICTENYIHKEMCALHSMLWTPPLLQMEHNNALYVWLRTECTSACLSGFGGGRVGGGVKICLDISCATVLRDKEFTDRCEYSQRQALKSIKQIHFGIQTKGCHKCISWNKRSGSLSARFWCLLVLIWPPC